MKKSTKKVVIIICCVLAVALIAGGTVVSVNVYNKNMKEQQIEQILSDIKGKYDTFVNESDRDKRIVKSYDEICILFLIFCLAIDKNTQHNYNCSNRCNGVLE